MAGLTLKVDIEADTSKLDRNLESSLKKPRLLENIKASIGGFGEGVRTGGLKAIMGGKAEGMAENIGKIAISTALLGYVYKGITYLFDLLKNIRSALETFGGSLKGIVAQLEQVVKILVLPFANFLASLLRPFVSYFLTLGVKISRWLTSMMQMKTLGEKVNVGAGALIGGVGAGIISGGNPFWTALGAMLGAGLFGIFNKINSKILEFWIIAIAKIGDLWNKLTLATATVWANAMNVIWTEALEPAFNFLGGMITAVWESVLYPAFNFLATIPMLIWTTILLPSWTFLSSVPKLIWETILLPAWNFLKSVGSWIWNDILRPPFVAVADAIRSAVSAINSAIAGISSAINYVMSLLFGKKKKQLGGIVTMPSLVNVAEREPEIIVPLSKARQDLGLNRGMNYSPTINIYATLNKEMDIRNLAEKLAEYSKDALTRRVSYFNI